MANYLFKFSTLASAKFVVERLNQMGVKAAYMPSGYISVSDLSEATKKVIKDSLGTHVAATGVEDLSISKYAGTGQGKKKLAPKTEDPKSPPTANGKTLKKYGNTNNAQTKGNVGEEVKPKTEKDSDSSKPKKSEAPKISPEGQKMLNLRSMAYETLKRIVEKNPKGFPRLAKIMGFKVKS